MSVNKNRSPSVKLVSMPWTNFDQPNLGLGILKAALETSNIHCQVHHLNLELLQYLRPETYLGLSKTFALNDFLFSGVLDRDVSRHQRRILVEKVEEFMSLPYIDPYLLGGVDGCIESLLTFRNETVPEWLDEWARRLASSKATLVGFSCNFDQTIASVALAKKIKAINPEIMVILGGYAVRSPTAQQLVASFPWVDGVCIQEGEPVIDKIAYASIGRCSLSDIPGMIFGGGDNNQLLVTDVRTEQQVTTAIHETPKSERISMDESPVPNYQDFFDDIEALSTDKKIDITVETLPIENSRGCWWGQKSHCVFCGIDKADMFYQYKNPQKVLQSLNQLQHQFGITQFRFADYILPHNYYSDLLPELSQLQPKLSLKGELKANISFRHFQLLKEAGFKEIQPGIESFSDSTLRTMRKGVSAAQNIHLMRMGRESNILVLYNLIYGFPNDAVEEYEELVGMIPSLVHLDPPSSVVPVQITRYAPMQERPEEFGLTESQYHPDYELIFSDTFLQKHNFNLNDFCYYFERPYENSPKLEQLYAEVERQVMEWNRLTVNERPTLELSTVGQHVSIVDSRFGSENCYSLLTQAADLLVFFNEPRSEQAALNYFGGESAGATISQVVEWLLKQKLLLRAGKNLISLVMDPARYECSTPSVDSDSMGSGAPSVHQPLTAYA